MSKETICEQSDRIALAVGYILDLGSTGGANHKQYALDQALRALTGDEYGLVVSKFCEGKDGPNTYSWETGCAP